MELRDVRQDDLDVLFEHQADPVANQLAAFPAREREAFDAHWARTLRNPANVAQVIVDDDGTVVGNVLSWPDGHERYVGYWIGRAHWGKGYASWALARLLELVPQRPLTAIVAEHNRASIRVLEKCGFAHVGSEVDDVALRRYELR